MDLDIIKAKQYGRKRRLKEWERHNELINSPIPSIEELVELLLNLKNKKFASFLALVYLSGARVSEIIRYKDYKTGIEGAGIKRKDIYIDKDSGLIELGEVTGPKVIVIRTKVLKIPLSKIKRNPSLGWKHSYIDCQDKRYFPLVKLIDDYMEDMNDQSQEAELFTFSYQYVSKELSRLLKWNVHYLRHMRAAHLVRYHDFKDTDLRLFFGWISGDMPSRYTHGSEERLKSLLLS